MYRQAIMRSWLGSSKLWIRLCFWLCLGKSRVPRGLWLHMEWREVVRSSLLPCAYVPTIPSEHWGDALQISRPCHYPRPRLPAPDYARGRLHPSNHNRYPQPEHWVREGCPCPRGSVPARPNWPWAIYYLSYYPRFHRPIATNGYPG